MDGDIIVSTSKRVRAARDLTASLLENTDRQYWLPLRRECASSGGFNRSIHRNDRIRQLLKKSCEIQIS